MIKRFSKNKKAMGWFLIFLIVLAAAVTALDWLQKHGYVGTVSGAYIKSQEKSANALGLNPSGSSGASVGSSASNNQNSYFFVRSMSLFRNIDLHSININPILNGIMYELEPHGYVFNKDVTFTLLNNGQTWGPESDLIFLEIPAEEMNSYVCSKTNIKTTTAQVGPTGGSFTLDDFTTDIPSGALSSSITFTLKKLDVSCSNKPINISEPQNTVILSSLISSILSSLLTPPQGDANDFKLVIGQSAAPEDNIAAIDIAGFLKISQTKYDTDYSIYDSNLIVVGGPCINRKAAELLGLSYPTCGTASTIPENKGMIRAFSNNGKTQILIAGWNSNDTRVAAQTLIKLNNQMSSNSITTSGTLNPWTGRIE